MGEKSRVKREHSETIEVKPDIYDGEPKVKKSRPEYHSQCYWDYIEIRDGGKPNSPMIGRKRCGTTRPGNIKSSSNQLYIKFKTDSSVTRSGFAASFNKGTFSKVFF